MSGRLRAAFLALVWALALLLPGPGRADSAIRVGTYLDNRPWEFRDGSGTIVGFEVEMMKLIGKRLGRPVELVPMPFLDLFRAVNDGRIDVAMSSVSITSERTSRYDFSQAYYDTSQAVVVMKKSGIRGLGDLVGRVIAVTPGTTNERWILANEERYQFRQVRGMQGLDDALPALTSGEIDAYFGDLPALLYQLLQRPDLAIAAQLPTHDRYGLMLAKGSPLTPKIDGAITELKNDGTMARIHQRWFGITPEKSSSTIRVLPRP